MKNQYGSWCLLAGAAEGLGEAFAESLARRGLNLILVDHQAELLHSLGAKLERTYGMKTRRLHLDLADKGSLEPILKSMEETSCRMLIYNAAFSKIRRFKRYAATDLDRFLQVNAWTPLHLVHGLVQGQALKSGQRASIILMASFAGLWGSQFLAPYGATKAFTMNLAEALHHELKPEAVDVMACVAGPISTPAYLATRPKQGRAGRLLMSPEQVAEETLKSVGRKAIYIPGRRNRLHYFLLTRILSRTRTALIFNDSIRKMYPET
jgi:short-subunit dehydrogenase